ncbi:hypothetical protein C923_00422 [Plasmodium falciparum UGT5.1]|uniref:Plasmodium falciparum erythrocyte membrane protein 1 acidic terminal segment domain-containing protein n=1 Tax=Plasmodium falciparum UGT5.1 TaxID=1237627 RepID=W7JVG9_PLAFA|nr:hypothetical protein C923_00422 [Plasmodium falciparum UGT5.1]
MRVKNNKKSPENFIIYNTRTHIYIVILFAIYKIETFEYVENKLKKPNITSGRTNLFRVIDVSENSYEIFTTKSPNRYVPYESDRYVGKTYIYVEGDETDDYSYIRDIYSSDITSSSESEYEEIDVNYIYVLGSTKCKTFIEVVLEPSKRDTFNL